MTRTPGWAARTAAGVPSSESSSTTTIGGRTGSVACASSVVSSRARRLRDAITTVGSAGIRDASQSSGLRSSRCTAGPCSTSPSGAKREPWHGQSQLRSAVLNATRQPRCVHVARDRRQRAVLGAVGRDGLALVADQGALAGPQVGGRARVALEEAVADEVQADLGVLLHQRGRRGAQVEPVRVEQAGPGVLAAEDPVAEHARRRGAAGHAPLGEPGRHQHAVAERRQRARVREAVGGHVVLRRPAEVDRAHGPVLARERLELEVVLLGVAAGAGAMALAADEQQLLVAVDDRAHGARRRPGADEHALGRGAVDPAEDRVRALRRDAGERERAVEEREVRRDDDAVGDARGRPGS